jgi:SAM-dependent methyltransferase
MPNGVIDPAGFEAKYQDNIDPWNYRTSPFEAWKRRLLLHACGNRTFGRGLELACGTGEISRALAPKCLHLVAQDSSRTAITAARAHGARDPHRIDYRVGVLPDDMPRGPFDLIVASEILYYLRPKDMRGTLSRMISGTAPGGRIVLLHHLLPFGDAAILPRRAQACAVASLHRRMKLVSLTNAGRFQVAAFVSPLPGERAFPSRRRAFLSAQALRHPAGTNGDR